MKKKIILASSSPYRAALLRRAGVPFEVIRPNVDETPPAGSTPEEAVVEIAMRKMRDAAERGGEGVVVASDQAMEFAGKLMGKPGSAKAAVDMLMALAGKEHRLLTSLVVRNGRNGNVHSHLDIHRIKLRDITRAEARRYVQLDWPIGCAGGIKIESRGILLVERAEGEDYTSIIGLPMMALGGILRRMGIEPFPPGGGAGEDWKYDLERRPWRLDASSLAVLVMDMQKYFTGEGDGFAFPIIQSINELTDAARRKSVPVIFTKHGHEDPAGDGGMLGEWWGNLIISGTPEHELDPFLVVKPVDIILPKKRYSAFAGTGLESMLRGKGIRQLAVAGTMTNLCCETTAREAFVRDFEVFFFSDATATAEAAMHSATLYNLSYGFAHIVETREFIEALDSASGQS